MTAGAPGWISEARERNAVARRAWLGADDANIIHGDKKMMQQWFYLGGPGLLEDVARALDALDAIAALHAPKDDPDFGVICSECSDRGYQGTDHEPHPCPTVRAIQGEEA